MTSDGIHTYTYDAAGNVVSVDGGGTAQYVYGAANHRVWSDVNGATYEFLYDAFGKRMSSWIQPQNIGQFGRIYWDGQQIAFNSSDATTYFDHQDWLGTTRLRTDYDGNVAATFKSLPFGDGSSSTINETYAVQDSTHFATLDLDSESDTNQALFRQYSNTIGGWMSPDPQVAHSSAFARVGDRSNLSCMPSRLQRFHNSEQTHFITYSCWHRRPNFADVATRPVFEAALERVRRDFSAPRLCDLFPSVRAELRMISYLERIRCKTEARSSSNHPTLE
ncbi:MAG TPA: hypothetical protein VMD58_11985 [Acidobacteriaceae bacterium]|nr:hypothetical protein [Acidobacteriaceae bacterium]